jgi:hypothetical protein
MSSRGPQSSVPDLCFLTRSACVKAPFSTLLPRAFLIRKFARNLAIAPETVKSHVKNIFTKLDAEKRPRAHRASGL